MLLESLTPDYSPLGLGVYFPNLGDQADTAQIATAANATAGSIVVALAPAYAIPIVGVVVAAVALAIYLFSRRKGPGQRIKTTEIVNELEPELLKNVQGYLAGPRTVSSQAVALANFDNVWALLEENCRTEEMGDPGIHCVEDREAGACTWKDNGKCWNWFVGYRDPIANDVPKPDSSVLDVAGGSIHQVLGGVLPGALSGGGGLLLLVGAAALAYFAFTGQSKK